MPKAILEYDLPEERDDFDLAMKAAHLDYVIYELDNYLRGKLKYGELTDDQDRLYQEIRDKLTELKNE